MKDKSVRHGSEILNRELIEKIRPFLATAQTLESVADICGICRMSIWTWIRRGEKELTRMSKPDAEPTTPREQIYLEFVLMTRKAFAARELSLVQIIQNAAMGEKTPANPDPKKGKRAPGTWQAAAWLLERWKPEDYGADKRRLAIMQDQIEALEKKLEGKG